MAKTLYDKIWDAHLVDSTPGETPVIYIDRHLVHEVTSPQAFEGLRLAGRKVRRPELTLAVADHNVPTKDRDKGITDPESRAQVEALKKNTSEFGVEYFAMDDIRAGIVHIIGPEQGWTLPGTTIVCGDSHTSTHGAFGALAFGIGASEVAHVLMTQTLWQKKPKRMRIAVRGPLGPHVTAKDLALHVIATVGANGAHGHAVEYQGEAIRTLSMESRLTLCNMSIEAGARSALVAPDDTTFAYLAGRPHAPSGADLDRAIALWRSLATDEGASFDREVAIDAAAIAPTVTFGTSPEDALPITARVPDAPALADALAYMGLAPGQRLVGIPVDRVFIGSCTNGRLEDLRAAAAVLRGRRAAVPGLVSPGSTLIKQAAEAEGLHNVFLDAGLEWADSGCSMCVGMNGDLIASGQRCASTTNRNFRGRQGQGARTHLMSPAMAAAAAIAGHLADVRDYPPLER